MRILILLIAVFAGFCFACKSTFDHCNLISQRQQLLANSAPVQEAPTQPQAIYAL